MVPERESTMVREAWQQVTGAGGREITSSTTIMKYEEWTGSGANYKLSAHPKWCTSSSGTPPPKGSITSQTVPPTGHCVQIPEPMRTFLTQTPARPASLCLPLVLNIPSLIACIKVIRFKREPLVPNLGKSGPGSVMRKPSQENVPNCSLIQKSGQGQLAS